MFNAILNLRLEWKFIDLDGEVLSAEIDKKSISKIQKDLPPGFTITNGRIEYKAEPNQQELYKFLCAKWMRGDDQFRTNMLKYDYPIFIELRHNTTNMWLFDPKGTMTLTMPYDAFKFDFPETTNIYRVR